MRHHRFFTLASGDRIVRPPDVMECASNERAVKEANTAISAGEALSITASLHGYFDDLWVLAAREAPAWQPQLARDCLVRRKQSRKRPPVDRSVVDRRNTNSHRPTTNTRSVPTDSRGDTRARVPRAGGQNGAGRSGDAHGASPPAVLPFSAPARMPTARSP